MLSHPLPHVAPAAIRPERASPYEIVYSPTRGCWLVIDASGHSDHATLADAQRHAATLERMLSRSALPALEVRQ